MWEIVCTLIGHKRDAHKVRHDGNYLRSRCKRCGAPLKRLHGGGWIVQAHPRSERK